MPPLRTETKSAEPAVNYTQEEWVAIIADAERNLPKTFRTYEAPKPGTVEFAKCIDHTLLKLDATEEQIDQLCKEARQYDFKTVCVRLPHVSHCVSALQNTSIGITCVIDFHEGTAPTAIKANEAALALAASATDLDIVLHHHLLPPRTPSPSYPALYLSLHTLRHTAPPPTILKLILETSQLTQQAIIAACVLAKHAGFDFVKTSTGFNGRGATVEDVRVMKSVVGEGVGVKASAGVRSVGDCVAMMEAGAGRVGTSGGVGIMEEGRRGVYGGGPEMGRKEGGVGY